MAEELELRATVTPELQGSRLDQAAASLFDGYSRSRLQAWIRSGELRVDGRPGRPREPVSAGMELTINATLAAEVRWAPQEIALDILYEDADILVLDKPAGLVVHPAAGHREGTLVNALLARAPELERVPRAGIVHRLDKDTSGVMVVARNLVAHGSLVAQLQARTVSREYRAVCLGALTGGDTVEAPIGRHPRQRKKMAVVSTGGRRAVTHYRIARRFGHHTLLAVTLETGRTHQIRVHLAHRHHPLLGDPVYGGRPRPPPGASAALVTALRQFPRQALHAHRLGLRHPASGESMHFECDLPRDLRDLIDLLGREDPPLSHAVAD